MNDKGQERLTPWSSGLCDCCSDPGSCCLTFWCPCISFGRVAEIVDQGTISCCASGAVYFLLAWFTQCHWIMTCLNRAKLRKQYMLEDRPCNDCLVHFFCGGCALCQEYRELQNRGFDLSIGWHENVKQNPGVAMGTKAPVVAGGMAR